MHLCTASKDYVTVCDDHTLKPYGIGQTSETYVVLGEQEVVGVFALAVVSIIPFQIVLKYKKGRMMLWLLFFQT